MRRWLPEAESLMPALEVQFRVLKGNRGHVLQTRICSKPSRDPAPRFQYTIFSSISCAALRHGVFSVLPGLFIRHNQLQPHTPTRARLRFSRTGLKYHLRSAHIFRISACSHDRSYPMERQKTKADSLHSRFFDGSIRALFRSNPQACLCHPSRLDRTFLFDDLMRK